MRIPRQLLEQTLAGYDALIRDALAGSRRERYKLIADLCDQAEVLLDMAADSVEEVDAGQANVDATEDYGMGVMGGRRVGRRRLRRPNQAPILMGAHELGGNDPTRTMVDTFSALVGPQSTKNEQDARTARAIELRELFDTRRRLEDDERTWPARRPGGVISGDAPFPEASLLDSIRRRIAEIEREMTGTPAVPTILNLDGIVNVTFHVGGKGYEVPMSTSASLREETTTFEEAAKVALDLHSREVGTRETYDGLRVYTRELPGETEELGGEGVALGLSLAGFRERNPRFVTLTDFVVRAFCGGRELFTAPAGNDDDDDIRGHEMVAGS